MLIRAGTVWFGIMLLAILNGAARDILLVPRMGDLAARAISCITLGGLILVVAWISLPWIRPASMGDAWTIGALWLVMTLTFEFVAGHYLFRTPWPTLLADYNLLAGRLWIVVLAATLIAPALAYRAEQNPVPPLEISSPSPDDTPRR
jgi:hypothetical protein